MSAELLTITEAARRCGCSTKTLRNRIKAGAFPGAHQAGNRPLDPWVIPSTDLVAAGFTLTEPEPAQAPAPVGHDEAEELVRLRVEVEQLRERAERAERQAEDAARRVEIERNRLDAALESLRIAVQAVSVTAARTAPQVIEASTPPRRRWFRRGA